MNKIQQFDVISLTESRLTNANRELTLSLSEARANEEVIQIADGECLRRIRQITNHPYDPEILADLLRQKKRISRRARTTENAAEMKRVCEEIDKQTFIPEFVSVQFPKKANYRKIGSSGFTLNGEKYIRLMCGAGHARTNRVMFVQKKIFKELDRFMRAGCNDIEIVLAKWNAYYALGGSATLRVSAPRAAVIPDCNITRKHLVDFATPAEPQDTLERVEKELSFNLWDGMGLISPEMAQKWGQEIGDDYIPGCFVIRNAFVKGLVATFDFRKFAHEKAGKTEITDIYGKTYNVDDLDVILTESQFKLWRAYDSWDSYIGKITELGWHWGVTKAADSPSSLKRYMRTNYQFLQVLQLSDRQLANLCQPTLDWFQSLMTPCTEDISKPLLYLLGKTADANISSEELWNRISDPFIRCLAINPALIKDSYIQNRIISSLNKRIRQAYMGRLMMDATYQFLVADPYALCEYMFGMPINGLIPEHQCYNKHWQRFGASRVCVLRSPLTWRSEVNGVFLTNTEEADEWYKYIDTGHIETIHGLDNMLAGGADEDGDCVLVTNNKSFWEGRA